jgi:hypothetical protein
LEWLKRVFDPQTRGQANQKPRVLICDGFGTHETLEALEFCFQNNILLCRLPSHTSHKLQPCDLGVFAPLKAAYRDEAERLFQGGANTVGKQHFTSLYSPAREKAFTKRNITAAWAACGLFPFNPDRVLRVTPKPPAQSTVADEIRVGSCHQDEVPQTPVTPVSAEGLAYPLAISGSRNSRPLLRLDAPFQFGIPLLSPTSPSQLAPLLLGNLFGQMGGIFLEEVVILL